MNILEKLQEHKRHYFVGMEGHKVCPKCYAIKLIKIFKREQKNQKIKGDEILIVVLLSLLMNLTYL
jgi:hypothetical protein